MGHCLGRGLGTLWVQCLLCMLGDLSMNLRIHVSRQAWWSASEISVLEVRRVEEEWKWGGGGVGRVCLGLNGH